MTHECENCAAAVAEAAAALTILRDIEWAKHGACPQCGGTIHTRACELANFLEGVSPAVERLERRLASMLCGHPGACVVSSDEDAGYCEWCVQINVLRSEVDVLHKRLERAKALAALVPEAEWLYQIAEIILYAAAEGAIAYKVRALAARIEDARREQGKEGGGGDGG